MPAGCQIAGAEDMYLAVVELVHDVFAFFGTHLAVKAGTAQALVSEQIGQAYRRIALVPKDQCAMKTALLQQRRKQLVLVLPTVGQNQLVVDTAVRLAHLAHRDRLG